MPDTPSLSPGDRKALLEIARQIRDLADKPIGYALETGGRLLVEAIECGAFSGPEFLQFRLRFDPKWYYVELEYSRCCGESLLWLSQNLDDLPVRCRPEMHTGPYRDAVGSFCDGFVPVNFPAAASLIEEMAAEEQPAGPTAVGRKDKGEKTGKRDQEDWVWTAMNLVREHPHWPDAKIAREVGKDRSTLCRNCFYQAAANLARSNHRDQPKGHIVRDPETGLNDVDGVSREPDPAEQAAANLDGIDADTPERE